MIKIAVLLYGHLRDYELCASSLKKYLLNRFDCDVFMHTWDETDSSTFSWHSQRTQVRTVDDITIETLKGFYSPKKLVIEHQQKYGNEEIIESPYLGYKFSTANIHWLFYTMNKANELRKEYEKESGINYDFVLVTRPDVEMKRALDIDKILLQSDILGLDSTKCRYFASTPINMNHGAATYFNEPNDILFFAKPEVVDKYIEANQQIDKKYILGHAINMVSIYTSREIETNILPVPTSYSLGRDWTFSKYRLENYLEYQKYGKGKMIVAKIVRRIIYPFFEFYKKHKWLYTDL